VTGVNQKPGETTEKYHFTDDTQSIEKRYSKSKICKIGNMPLMKI
jgi:hypothetical protein